MLGIAIVTALGAVNTASATCARIGPYDRASVTFDDANGHVTIYGEQFGNYTTGPGRVCDDSDVGADPAAHALMTITVDGVERCRRTDGLARLTADPFHAFGGGIHTVRPNPDDPNVAIPDGPCGADIGWDELTGTPSPSVEDIGVGSGGVYAGRRKAANVSGRYWLDGGAPQMLPQESGELPVASPLGSRGWFSRGARVAVA